MSARSLLFVPGDRPDRFAKAVASGADAIILDLEDSVTPERKPQARNAVAGFLASPCPLQRLVRVNALDSAMLADDLPCLAGAEGVVLPKAQGAHSVTRLAALLPAPLPILPIATETPAAIFALGTYREVSAHLLGLTWGAEDLPAAIGAVSSRGPDGTFTEPYRIARALALFAAHAAGVAAIETVYPAIADEAGLRRHAQQGHYDGFTGMLAIHPAQVPIINAAFTPDAAQVHAAEQVVAAFAAAPQAGALMLDGRMIDAPHLAQARRLLARASAANRR